MGFGRDVKHPLDRRQPRQPLDLDLEAARTQPPSALRKPPPSRSALRTPCPFQNP
jgi:hypothetical protein